MSHPPAPRITHFAWQGQFDFRFSLVYTSLEEVLPAVEELCILAQQDGGKAERQAAKERLDHIIQVQSKQGWQWVVQEWKGSAVGSTSSGS